MNNKLKQIVEDLQSSTDMLYAEGAFQYYIDNQINEQELIEILKVQNFTLPENFSSLPVRKKKTYLNHIQTRIYFENGEPKVYWYEVFNNRYFYYLAEVSRKNKSITRKFIDYIVDIGNEINLTFLGMQYIKVANCNLGRFETIINYCKEKEISNVYDLLISVFSERVFTIERRQLQNLIIDQIKKESLFNIDLDDVFYRFALNVECALELLTRKEANTIKVKFQILNKEHLRDIDYYSDEMHQKRIINTFKKKMTNNKVLGMLSGHIIDNQEEFDKFQPNGYSAVYYYLLEEGL